MLANFGPAQVFQPLSAVTLWRDDVIVKFFDRSREASLYHEMLGLAMPATPTG